MSKFARVVAGTVAEVFTPPEGVTIQECFHADVAAMFQPCPNMVEVEWTTDGKEAWAPPPVVPSAIVYPKVGPIHFQMLFTPEEAITADTLKATDKVLASFWKLVDDPRTDTIDLGLQSVQNAIEYTLTAINAAGVDLDVQARNAAILSGVLK